MRSGLSLPKRQTQQYIGTGYQQTSLGSPSALAITLRKKNLASTSLGFSTEPLRPASLQEVLQEPSWKEAAKTQYAKPLVADTIGEASLDNETHTDSTPSPDRQLSPRKALVLVPQHVRSEWNEWVTNDHRHHDSEIL